MKKRLPIFMIVALLIGTFSLPASAASILAYGLSEYGQQTFVVGKPTTTPPTVDGVVSENEYTNHMHLTPESEGMVQIGVTNQDALADYIDIYVSYDDENIYMAAVVQEDEYTFKNGASQYSSLCVNFGFRTNGSSVQAMDRMECTLAINDPAATSFFTGIGYYEYDNTGKYYPNLDVESPVAGGKDWSFMGTAMPQKKFVRTVDENQNNITVYEFALSKAVLKKAFRTDELSDTLYFWFENYSTCNGARVGNLAYRHLLNDEEKTALKKEYGWCATFVGHLMVLGEEMNLDLTVDPDPADIVQLHGSQMKEDADGTYSIRFVGSIDHMNYQEIGYVIRIEWNGSVSELEKSCTTVYRSMQLGDEEVKTAAELRGEEEAYLFILAIEDIPSDVGEVAFTVTPFGIRTDGSRETGESHRMVYDGGTYVPSGEEVA